MSQQSMFLLINLIVVNFLIIQSAMNPHRILIVTMNSQIFYQIKHVLNMLRLVVNCVQP